MEHATKSLILLKLGGSILTDDDQIQVVRSDILASVFESLGILAKTYQFIIVHGAGSFGHYHAKKYHLISGFKEKQPFHGVLETQASMLTLNQYVLDTASKVGLFPVSFPPRSLCTTTNGRINSFNVEPFRYALDTGFTPITFGDVVFDKQSGVTILSGDQITPYLAQYLPVTQIIMLTDVDGVYDRNPKTHPGEARLLPELNLHDTALLQRISAQVESGKTRVTGEMEKKLMELKPAVLKGVDTWIMSGLNPQNLVQRLQNNKAIGTRIILS